ncbi:hypothetical protein ACWDSJ_27780 [Nocardia sp. NPDC003482]
MTALDALHATVERVKEIDPADTAAALATVHAALALTATANTLIHDALMELGQVYAPGRDFLDGARREYLARAVDTLASALGTSTLAPEHRRVRVLTSPDIAPREYHPFQPDGVRHEAPSYPLEVK